MDKKFILLIDDNEAIRDSLTWALNEEGYFIVTAENGQVGMDILQKDPLPSLIIVDLMMPVMDGYEFCALKKADPRLSNIPIVITSTKSNLQKHFQPLPHKTLLPKPFDINELLDVLKQHC